MSAKETALAIQLGRAIDQGNISQDEAEKYIKLGRLASQNPDAERLATYRSGGSMDQEIPDLAEVEKRLEGVEPKDRPKEDQEKTTKMQEEAARLKTASIGQGQTYLQGQGMLAVAEAKPPEEKPVTTEDQSLAQQKIGPGEPGKKKGEEEDSRPRARQGQTTTRDQAGQAPREQPQRGQTPPAPTPSKPAEGPGAVHRAAEGNLNPAAQRPPQQGPVPPRRP